MKKKRKTFGNYISIKVYMILQMKADCKNANRKYIMSKN